MDPKNEGFSHRTCFFQVCILRCHVSFLGFVKGDLLVFYHGQSPLNHHLEMFSKLFSKHQTSRSKSLVLRKWITPAEKQLDHHWLNIPFWSKGLKWNCFFDGFGGSPKVDDSTQNANRLTFRMAEKPEPWEEFWVSVSFNEFQWDLAIGRVVCVFSFGRVRGAHY